MVGMVRSLQVWFIVMSGSDLWQGISTTWVRVTSCSDRPHGVMA